MVRRLTGVQDFVERAPLNVVYVANLPRMTGASAEHQRFFLAADAGVAPAVAALIYPMLLAGVYPRLSCANWR